MKGKIFESIFSQNLDFLHETHFLGGLTLFENYSKCRIWILAFSTNFCPIKTDLSGNTVWQQALGFQKLAKMDHFVHSKCKRSSLRSQCWMRLFLWFSNTVSSIFQKKIITLKPVNCPVLCARILCLTSATNIWTSSSSPSSPLEARMVWQALALDTNTADTLYLFDMY